MRDLVEFLRDNPWSWTIVGGFFTIVGVIAGLFGGEAFRWWRERRDIKKGMEIIFYELKSIKSQLPFIDDILDKSIKAIENKQILSITSAHTPSLGYKTYILKLYKRLSQKQRNCLHVIYENLRVNDEFMDGYEKNILQLSLQFSNKIDYYDVYEKKLKAIRNSYLVSVNLIDSFLKNDPTDVFYVDDEIPENYKQMKNQAIPPKVGDYKHKH